MLRDPSVHGPRGVGAAAVRWEEGGYLGAGVPAVLHGGGTAALSGAKRAADSAVAGEDSVAEIREPGSEEEVEGIITKRLY